MKSIKHGILALAICVMALGLAQVAQAAGEYKGTWAIEPSKHAGMVSLAVRHRSDDEQSNIQMNWPTSALSGLDLKTPGKHDVTFVVSRDAGRVDFEGFMKDEEGAGTFRFTPDTKFVASMSAIGFPGIDAPKQFAMALHDVSLDYAKQMKAENLSNLDTDKLLAFRVFNVNPQFIRDMRAAGVPAKDADRLIAFRVHGVTPAMVRELRKSSIDTSEDQLIAFRVHGVTPEFVQKVEKLGFAQPGADQLVAMRVHGVTPEYIAGLKSRGLKDLTIDKVVSLKIHGIE
jgi:hypothetical protein